MKELLVPLVTNGTAYNIQDRVVARVTTEAILNKDDRKDFALLLKENDPSIDLDGYKLILTTRPLSSLTDIPKHLPIICAMDSVAHLISKDIVSVSSKGFIRTVYRANSKNNVLFATDRCNSLCLMCSQPPKKINDDYRVNEILEIIRLIDPSQDFLGISGGEPTLLGEGLFKIKAELGERLPNAFVNMLSNGRMFCYEDFARGFAEAIHPNFSVAIPIYSDIPEFHDHVVQSKGAFIQTLKGIYNLGALNQRIEVRIVIHKLTYERLLDLSKYIFRNIPFVNHIALMGLEPIGLTKMHFEDIWIDPNEYQEELFRSVEYLNSVRMNVSIYNHQLCVLHRELWPFARQSISDFKNIYLDECNKCSIKSKCGGLFKSAQDTHSKYIHAI